MYCVFISITSYSAEEVRSEGREMNYGLRKLLAAKKIPARD